MSVDLNGSLQDFGNIMAAIGALGTASFGLVDATKVYRGGVSNIGFGFIQKAVEPYQAALRLVNADDPLSTVKANWINGVAKSDQKAAVKSLIRLGITTATAADLAASAPGIDNAALVAVAQKIDGGLELSEEDINLLGRFDAILDAQMDAGFERADQQYRNAAKMLASVFAILLSLAGMWILKGQMIDGGDTAVAFFLGILSIPLAPIAKDLTSALGTAVSALKAAKGLTPVTVFMNFRERAVGGAVKDPSFVEGEAGGALKPVSEARIISQAAQRDILFATHGFNVSRPQGVCSLSRLETALELPSNCLFIGVLWPGDSWLPIINYPFEGATAVDCGRRLARFCDRKLEAASSLSFVTHSLGARLALEAAKVLRRRVRSICLTAAAINDDCLANEYAGAFKNSEIVSVLASRRDLVLKLAFPIGDPIADLLHADHLPFMPALGYRGPSRAMGATVPPWQIPDDKDYNHGDYLPPSDIAAPFPCPKGKWGPATGYMKRAFMRMPQTWP